MNWQASISATIAFGVTALLVRQFINPRSLLHFLDHPNDRSLHTRPVPRTGGVALLAGLLASAPFWAYGAEGTTPLLWILLAGAVVGGLSFIDDLRGVSAIWRLLGHVLGAVLIMQGLGIGADALLATTAVDPFSMVLLVTAVAFLVWMTNLYNFMDGMDGFAGGMTVAGFGAFAILGYLAGHSLYATFSLAIATAAGGFLLYNFPPARILMGDTGSAVLGLLAGVFCLWGARDGIFPFWIGLLVFSPFIVDATVTLTRRIVRGERFWEAHRTHYYQRLVQSGWGHRKTVLYEYGLMLACGGSAIWGRELTPGGQMAMAIGWASIYFMLITCVIRIEKKAKHDLAG